MTWSILFSEVQFCIIIVIGLFVAREFYRAKNGTLRKLMVWYFLIDVYVYLMGAFYVYFVASGKFHMNDALFRFLVLTPKDIIKIRLLLYLIGLNRAEKNLGK